MKHRSCRERGITLVEVLLVAVVLTIVIVVIFLAAFAPRDRQSARQLKDAAQIREILQALVTWGESITYPLPSYLEDGPNTVNELGEAKDTTANIFSILIFVTNISPEVFVSPAESDTAQVRVMSNYQYISPATAVYPDKAQWDPRFRGTPIDAHLYGTKPGISNNSYAHSMPIGKRRRSWSDTYSATDAVIGNRGPTYAADDFAPHPSSGQWDLLPGKLGTTSNTLLFHGGRTTWEGNIGYNDGRVQYETSPNPNSLTYRRAIGSGPKASTVATTDNLFVNESDEAENKSDSTGADRGPWMFDRATNVYLRPISDRSSAGPVTVWRD